MNDVTVVIPVYKENPEVVQKTYSDLVAMGTNVIIVDDGGTVDLPTTIKTIRYVPNMGYGYALKKGIEAADTDIVLTMDGDNQHLPEDALKLYRVYKMIKDCKMVVGQRWNLNEKPHRWFGRKVLNFIASCIAGHYLVDLNSGMRIFDRKIALGYKDILCDTFSFTTSLTMSMVTDGHKVAYFPIDVQPRKYGKSHVRLVSDGLVTAYYIIWVGLALRTRRLRGKIRRFFGVF